MLHGEAESICTTPLLIQPLLRPGSQSFACTTPRFALTCHLGSSADRPFGLPRQQSHDQFRIQGAQRDERCGEVRRRLRESRRRRPARVAEQASVVGVPLHDDQGQSSQLCPQIVWQLKEEEAARKMPVRSQCKLTTPEMSADPLAQRTRSLAAPRQRLQGRLHVGRCGVGNEKGLGFQVQGSLCSQARGEKEVGKHQVGEELAPGVVGQDRYARGRLRGEKFPHTRRGVHQQVRALIMVAAPAAEVCGRSIAEIDPVPPQAGMQHRDKRLPDVEGQPGENRFNEARRGCGLHVFAFLRAKGIEAKPGPGLEVPRRLEQTPIKNASAK